MFERLCRAKINHAQVESAQITPRHVEIESGSVVGSLYTGIVEVKRATSPRRCGLPRVRGSNAMLFRVATRLPRQTRSHERSPASVMRALRATHAAAAQNSVAI